MGGAGAIVKAEKQKGTFTNDPQLFNPKRSEAFQKSVESYKITENTNRAVRLLTEGENGLTPSQALIAVLAAQGITNENLIDIKLDVSGLENLREFHAPSGLFGFGGKGKGPGKGKKGEKE
jgi:hypothetical protein